MDATDVPLALDPIAAATAAANAAPPKPPDDPLEALRPYLAQRAKEISSAQTDANERQRWADMANGFERARAWGNSEKPDQGAIDSNNAQAQRPVTQALQRQAAGDASVKTAGDMQDLGTKAVQAGQVRASVDPNSDVSKRARLLAVAQGLIPASYPGEYTASMHQDMLKGADIATAAKKAQAEIAQARAQMAETSRHNRADETLKGQELGIQDKRATFEQAQKGRVPEQEASKVVNQTQALQAIDQLEKLHGEIGVLGLSPLGNSPKNRYDDAVSTLSGAVAAGALPAAKESPALMEEFKKGFPDATTGSERAKLAFQRLRETVKQNAAAQVAALKAGNYNPQQVGELERQINAGPRPSPAPAGANGQVRMRAPDGSEHFVTADKVEAAKAAGGTVL